MGLAADFVRGKPAKVPTMGLCPRCDPRTGNETNDRPKVAQEHDVVRERRVTYPHHGLIVDPQPFTMGPEDALDAYDAAQKEAKDAAVTNTKEESTTSVGTSSSAHSTSVGTANSVHKSSVGTAETELQSDKANLLLLFV